MINYAPDEESRALETYATWARLLELLPYYSWIVDRFHLSTVACQLQATGRAPDLGWLEDRLLPLGFRVVLCTRAPESFPADRAADWLEATGGLWAPA